MVERLAVAGVDGEKVVVEIAGEEMPPRLP
jgi:hypothetical protein